MNKAFLKWAGGKSQLLEKLTSLMPPVNSKGRYIEPFVGSGVIALNMPHSEIIVGDVNEGLMATWIELQRHGERFITAAKQYFTADRNTPEKFYEYRLAFNETTHTSIKAVLFLYLNRHCFNGLCRFNSKGEFNVPFGKYSSPYFPETELRQALEVTKRMTIWCTGFMDLMSMSRKGDVVYCDPPYLPINATSNFTAYSKGGFSMVEQENLARAARECSKKGATVIISNNDVPLAWELYKGAEMHVVEVAKKISCKGDGRKKLNEVIAVFRP
jgi:DNA adenine methylase